MHKKHDKPCRKVLSLMLTQMKRGVHAGCGHPLSAHWGANCYGVLFAPTTTDD